MMMDIPQLPSRRPVTNNMPWTVCGPVISISWALKQHMAGKRFASEADLKQPVAFWLQTLDKTSPQNRPRRPRGGVEVQLYSFFNLGARWGWVVNAMPRPLYPREGPGTHCIGGWVDPRAGLEGAEYLAPTGIRFPDRPARSESLCRLSYPGPYRHLIPMYSTPVQKPLMTQWDRCLNAGREYKKVCHVDTEVRIKFSASECLLL